MSIIMIGEETLCTEYLLGLDIVNSRKLETKFLGKKRRNIELECLCLATLKVGGYRIV